METVMIEWAKQAPMVAVVVVMLWVVYRDGKTERRYMMDMMDNLYKMVIQMSGGKVEDHEETLAKRPDKQ